MEEKTLAKPNTGRINLSSYVTGFVLSVLLTLVAYTLVQMHLHGGGFERKLLIGSLAALAAAQILVQLVFFLHLGHETRPRWKLVAFFFAVIVVAILIIGSLWIMYNLNYHMDTSPQHVNQYMDSQDGL